LGFTLAAVAVFHYYDGVRSAYVNAPNWWVVMGIAVSAWALGLVFRSRAAKRRGTSTGEDALLAVLFVGSMYAVRGLYGWMPFLLSLGTSSIVAYMGLATWRAVRSSDYALQHWTLKAHGRWTKAGAIYLLLMMLVYGGAGYGASEQLALARSARAQEALHHGLRAAQRGDMEQAIRDFSEARRLDTGLAEARDSLAGAYCAVGRYDEGLALFEESLQARPQDLDTRMLAVRAAMEANMAERALGHLEVALRLAPNDAALLDLRQRLLEARGQ
jgi:tetratricopeptide (TPR) repeat protein